MKVNVSPALVLLILALSATFFFKLLSPLFVFSVFNSIILAIIVGNYRPSSDEVDGGWHHLQTSYEDGCEDANDNVKDENSDSDIDDDDDEYRKENWFSDGYDEDDDERGSEGEIGWEEEDDDDEQDDSFRRRIEDFIARVNKGWRDEWLREYLDDQ